MKVNVKVIFLGQISEETGYREITVETNNTLNGLLTTIERLTNLPIKKNLKMSMAY